MARPNLGVDDRALTKEIDILPADMPGDQNSVQTSESKPADCTNTKQYKYRPRNHHH